jgi:hypothetical protein
LEREESARGNGQILRVSGTNAISATGLRVVCPLLIAYLLLFILHLLNLSLLFLVFSKFFMELPWSASAFLSELF